MVGVGIWLILRRKDRSAEPQVLASGTSSPSRTGEGAAFYVGVPGATVLPGAETVQQPSGHPQRYKYSKFVGDVQIDCNGIDMQSVEVSATIGGIEVRLHGCRLSKGLNRLIVSNFIGEIKIYAPKELPVFAHCTNFLGEIKVFGQESSGFGSTLDGQSSTYATSEAKLYIAANAFIGEIQIQHI